MTFDIIDRQFRRPEPVKLDAPEWGDPCANPRCSGILVYEGEGDLAEPGAALVCSLCAMRPSGSKAAS